MRAPGRRRRSTVDRLDPEIKKMIADLRIDFGWTIDEILTKLRELGQGEISRSALGRHVKSIEEVGAQLRHSREMAKALIEQVGDAPEDRVADLNIELLHAMILRLVTATNDEGDGQPVTFGPEDAMFLGRTIQSLASARKTNAEMIFKVRQETARAAAKAVDAVAKDVPAGLTRETVDEIKRRIMGIAA
ncbi:DUF3486 family protein [Sphingomonas canadensis]|uniref:DUF3486 family protein n=1 Tax=Sphingomonas canadensis TaxID=1219257 RepID=A0ABW3H499_9SPHN|nr:DUF3486 family protein [Sphingomonas canadensis]MCW3835984.1 DUF3486 family protein [Sphingomonas canadensis]